MCPVYGLLSFTIYYLLYTFVFRYQKTVQQDPISGTLIAGIGVVSYGVLGHLQPSTSNCLIFQVTSEPSKRRTLEGKNREEGNGKPPRLFSLDMIPIDGCFEDVLQLWPLFFDINCRLPSDGSH